MASQATCSTICFLLLALHTQGQNTLAILNPSFEVDHPKCGEMPAFWINRTADEETDKPSIAPGCYFVSTTAAHGERYMCLKTRRDQNNDQLGQRLNEGSSLEMDSIYQISLYLAYSPNLALAKGDGKRGKSFGKPALLRVWGVSHIGKNKELLAVTPVINHTAWQVYRLLLRPVENDYDEILFEAFFDPDQSYAYNGNVLIDSISAISKVSRSQVYGRPGDFILLENPSFEETPKCCEPPRRWANCGPEVETPTDIQPGFFSVTLPAAHGDTYLGMVVRDNNTVEAIGQRLPEPLQVGKKYLLRAHLARSQMMLSLSRSTGDEANYTTPVMLRVWGGNDNWCDKEELLFQTPLITTTSWREHELLLEPQNSNYTYLILEAYYKTPVLFSYNGNLLVDNLSLQKLE